MKEMLRMVRGIRVFAYVCEVKRIPFTFSGLVSATFGASLVTSPALGAYLSENWNDEAVVALATAVAALDIFFILVAVPESLPAKLRHSWDRVTWETADPFAVSLASLCLIPDLAVPLFSPSEWSAKILRSCCYASSYSSPIYLKPGSFHAFSCI